MTTECIGIRLRIRSSLLLRNEGKGLLCFWFFLCCFSSCSGAPGFYLTECEGNARE